MTYNYIIQSIADILKRFDGENPIHKTFRPGIGPFGEPQIVSIIANKLQEMGIKSRTKRTPDLNIQDEWAIEFKIVRPFGDNGKEEENWSVNLLHPYPGNYSLIGDAIKLTQLQTYKYKGLFVIGFEQNPAKIVLEPLLLSFEKIAIEIIGLHLGHRIQETRMDLVHPEHQILHCIGWQLND